MIEKIEFIRYMNYAPGVKSYFACFHDFIMDFYGYNKVLLRGKRRGSLKISFLVAWL